MEHVPCGGGSVNHEGSEAEVTGGGTIIGKSCRIGKIQVHPAAVFDDYPKANMTPVRTPAGSDLVGGLCCRAGRKCPLFPSARATRGGRAAAGLVVLR